jgi:hypothetical protein
LPALVVLIVLSIALYLYYKVRFFRAKTPLEKKWLSAKSSMALGLFVALFGVNRLLISLSPVSLIVATVFLIVGGMSLRNGWKAYKHYRPYAESE